ncbi:hypothetical protein [Nonomuraea endophytica]|uniref:hypothetical protein n=1 Tax=Nonomuraea endophytica TaxID=714136 RepID=UPI0037CAF5A1
MNHLIKLIRESTTRRHDDDDYDDDEYPAQSSLIDVLISCLEDEVPLAPNLVRSAIDCCIAFGRHSSKDRLPEALLNGKYEDALRAACLEEMEACASYIASAGSILGRLCVLRLEENEDATASSRDWVLERIRFASTERDKLEAAAFMMSSAYLWDTRGVRRHPSMAGSSRFPQSQAMLAIIDSLMQDRLSSPVTFMYVWSLCWAFRRMELDTELINALRRRLVEIWIECLSDHVRREVSWLLLELPIAPRGIFTHEGARLNELIRQECAAAGYGAMFRKCGVVLVGHYTGFLEPHDVAKLAIEALPKAPTWSRQVWEELSMILGQEGAALKAKIEVTKNLRPIREEEPEPFDADLSFTQGDSP